MEIQFTKLKTVFGQDVYFAELRYDEVEPILDQYDCQRQKNSKGFDSYYVITPLF